MTRGKPKIFHGEKNRVKDENKSNYSRIEGKCKLAVLWTHEPEPYIIIKVDISLQICW